MENSVDFFLHIKFFDIFLKIYIEIFFPDLKKNITTYKIKISMYKK